MRLSRCCGSRYPAAALTRQCLPPLLSRRTTEEIRQRTRLLENEVRVLRSESSRLSHEQNSQKEAIKQVAPLPRAFRTTADATGSAVDCERGARRRGLRTHCLRPLGAWALAAELPRRRPFR